MRPGYLRSTPVRTSKRAFQGLGAFGKGMMVPPPSPVPTGPAVFQDGRWVCEGAEPPQEVDGYWACCPSGWKKNPFTQTKPCLGKDLDLQKCGPLPDGMDETQVKCCLEQKRWALISVPGVDPCALPGQQGPILTAEDILAPELEFDRDAPLISPGMMIAGGAVFITLIGLAMLAR